MECRFTPGVGSIEEVDTAFAAELDLLPPPVGAEVFNDDTIESKN